jgi:hypothetical protein
MTTGTTTSITVSKNENFVRGTYNGFSILIRESDGFINATQLVDAINELDSLNKEL